MEAIHAREIHDHGHNHRSEALQDALKTAVLFGLGLYFAYNIVSGNLTNYINVRFSWLSYVAAALFIVLGVASAVGMLRRRAHHHHSHSHGQMSWAALGIVALPLVLGTLVPSRPLGAEAIDGNLLLNGAATTITSTTFTIAPENRNVLDWVRVFNSVADYGELEGQPADIVGFVYREPNFSDDQLMVARFTISCCVADASPIAVPAEWGDAPTLASGTWVRVQGTMAVGEFRGERVPVLRASSVEQVEQPEHPYLYP